MLAELLPWDFEYALPKGKSNCLCHDRLYQEKAGGALERPPGGRGGRWSRHRPWRRAMPALRAGIGRSRPWGMKREAP